MAKIRGSSLYAEKGDDLFAKGREFPGSKEIEKFCKTVLDKTFDTWVIVGRDVDQKNYKEIEGGDLMNGMVLCNLGNGGSKGSKHLVKNLEQKGALAMMLMDVVEGICDSEIETEQFLEALTETTKRMHARDRGEDVEAKTKEREKIEILEGLLHTAVDSLKTYKGKERYLKSCIGSAVIARVLEGEDEELKNKTRSSMKAAVLGEKGGDFATESVDRITDFVDLVLDAIDAGKSPMEIMSILNDFRKTF